MSILALVSSLGLLIPGVILGKLAWRFKKVKQSLRMGLGQSGKEKLKNYKLPYKLFISGILSIIPAVMGCIHQNTPLGVSSSLLTLLFLVVFCFEAIGNTTSKNLGLVFKNKDIQHLIQLRNASKTSGRYKTVKTINYKSQSQYFFATDYSVEMVMMTSVPVEYLLKAVHLKEALKDLLVMLENVSHYELNDVLMVEERVLSLYEEIRVYILERESIQKHQKDIVDVDKYKKPIKNVSEKVYIDPVMEELEEFLEDEEVTLEQKTLLLEMKTEIETKQATERLERSKESKKEAVERLLITGRQYHKL